MSLDKRLRVALTGIVPVIEPHQYRGTELEYATFNYSQLPDLIADSAPRVARYIVQVHWYLPLQPQGDVDTVNPNATKALIAAALARACGTWPSIEDATDNDGQHYVFELEAMEGGGYGSV